MNPAYAVLFTLCVCGASALGGGDDDTKKALDRKSALEWNDKGIDLRTAGKFKEAIAAFERALEFAPDEATVRSNLGATWNDEGVRRMEKDHDIEGAFAAFNQAAGRIPNDKTLTRNRGLAHDRRGVERLKDKQYDQALYDFEQALTFVPDDGNVAFHRCQVFYAREDFDRAETETEKLTAKFPKEAPGFSLLSEIRNKKGNVVGAREAMETAVAAAPDRADLKQRLEELKKSASVEGEFTPANSRHFQFHFPSNRTDQQTLADAVSGILEDAYFRVGSDFDCYPEGRTQVVFYEVKDFTAVTRADEWAGALFDGKIRVPIRDFGRHADSLRPTLFHEYTHRIISYLSGAACPTWLNEGLAMLSEANDVREAEAQLKAEPERILEARVLRGQWVSKLDAKQARTAYNQALSLTKYLIDQRGRGPVPRYLKAIGKGASAASEPKVFEEEFRLTFDELVSRWRLSLGLPAER